MAILPKGCKPDNFNHITYSLASQILKAFVQIFLTVNLSLLETLTFLLYVRQTWMTQLILAISL